MKRKKNLKGSKITVCSKGIQKNNTPREKEAQENEKYRDR